MKQFNEHHSFVGMQRDVSISKHPSSFLYDAKNIRLTSRNGDTLFAITNEKGTSSTDISLSGQYLGHCLLRQYLVVFTKSSSTVDHIYRIDLSTLESPTALFDGNLGFSTSHPIQAISSYENDNIQKVYWTDGNKQPRVINIAPSNDGAIEGYNSNSFDFVQELNLNESVKVIRVDNIAGNFPAGTIQYAFSYYKKHGQESNIFYTTPIYYTAYVGRAGSAESNINTSFQISISGVDSSNFNYLRVYSIMRTSLNATPVCKIVHDIKLTSGTTNYTYIDTGTNGEQIDPTSLLYIGGEEIMADTITQKDNTLFLGGIQIARPSIPSDVKAQIKNQFSRSTASDQRREFYADVITPSSGYTYGSLLNATNADGDDLVNPAGLMTREFYRCGVQFQHKSGRWSEPIWLYDVRPQPTSSTVSNRPTFTIASNRIKYKVPSISFTVNRSSLVDLIGNDYYRMRPVIVFPNEGERTVICQGIASPTLFTTNNNYHQSSWFFRPIKGSGISNNETVCPISQGDATSSEEQGDGHLVYNCILSNGVSFRNDNDIRKVEIEGEFDNANQFILDWSLLTLHSPDFEFSDFLYNRDLTNIQARVIGYSTIAHTDSDISIQTDSPTIDDSSSGFVHKSYSVDNAGGIVTGLFYEDYLVDDSSSSEISKFSREGSPVRFFVYPWQANGSINNDISRPSGTGSSTSVLKKKVISNLRICNANTYFSVGNDGSEGISIQLGNETPQMFYSDQTSMVKVGDTVYLGNIDTMLTQDVVSSRWFCFGAKMVHFSDTRWVPANANGSAISQSSSWLNTSSVVTPFNSSAYCYIHYNKNMLADEDKRLFITSGPTGAFTERKYTDYVGYIGDHYSNLASRRDQIRMKYKSSPHMVIKTSQSLYDAIEDSVGDSSLPIIELYTSDTEPSTMFGGSGTDIEVLKNNIWLPASKPVDIKNSTSSSLSINYECGDTWYNRYDCLKTYPFSTEDINQIVEIGSFYLASHCNMDGRYDRNRGLSSNLNASSVNFNLFNPVYNQLDSFFSYRLLDEEDYGLHKFPNQFTWTKEKQSGADIDAWTNITLANIYDMDGSKGSIVSLNTWKDQIYCFQNKGVSNILFNSRVQIPASDGIPIEISNSYKVDGYRYISDGIGCNDMNLIKETPSGIYFVDSISKHLYHIGNDIQDVSSAKNMTSWFNASPSISKIAYDEINHDIYLVTSSNALCFSEVLGQFTSFMDYGNIPFIESYGGHVFTLKESFGTCLLYKLFEGNYNYFFTQYKPWYFTFISNGLDAGTTDFDKIFSTLDYRMDMYFSELTSDTFSYIKVTNEYQDTGDVSLSRAMLSSSAYNHGYNLEKKFRNWRIQIPRNNNSLDRIRNTWCKITLGNTSGTNKRAVFHDLNVQYFI